MANSILNTMQTMTQLSGNSAISPQMLQQFQQFKNSFKGDPKQQVMRMVRNGARSNEQLQQAMNMARQLQSVLK
jgi:hypothetical protein